jgi:hypothetical protein
VLIDHEYCWLEGFSSWSELPVPMNVLLIRERYADGHCQEWALRAQPAYAARIALASKSPSPPRPAP